MSDARSGLAYSERGSGDTVVLVHGWCLNGRLWTYQEEALAHEHRVVVPDLPGFGASAGLPGPYGMERQADALEALIEEVGGPAIVVGFAFGAAVGMTLAARRSPAVRALLSVGVPSAAHGAYDRMPRAMRRDWPEFARRSARAICKGEHSDATFHWLETMFVGTPLAVAIETVGVLGVFEPQPLAASVEVPALLVHGENDDVVPSSVSAAFADATAAGRLEILEGSGHLAILDAKERFNQVLLEFARDPRAMVSAAPRAS